MNTELLDIVDENNALTGKSAPRNIIHAEGIWHRTIHIYLFRKNDKEIDFLVHLRSPLKDLDPNSWDTRFGGHIKAGKTIEEGLESELKEEVGLDTNQYNLIEGFWQKRDKFPNCEFTIVYYLEYKDDLAKLKFNDGEVQEVKWMSIQDIIISMDENPNKWAAGISGFTEVTNYLKKERENVN